MTTPPSSTSAPETRRSSDERPRPGGPGVWIAGLAASALLHLAFLVVYPILLGRIAPEPAAILPAGPAPAPRGMEVVRISELPEPSAEPLEEPPEPEEDEPEPEPATPRPAPTTEPAPTEDVGDPRSAAERLRVPETGDDRIWRPVDPALTELTDEQRARLRFLGRLEAMNDSALAAEARARAGREWVYTDEEGRKWGVSPGQLHLGGITVPMPFGFSAPPSARDRMTEWRWDDVERGAATSIIRDTWKERVKAIRERRDAERADTSGIRR